MRDTDDVALTICDLELKSKGELLNYQLKGGPNTRLCMCAKPTRLSIS
ncbi:unnamed protein product [Amaranthus hypochondriacus]